MLDALVEFREKKGVSAGEMPDILGVSPSLYEKVERGYRPASRAFLEKFKTAFPDSNIDGIFFAQSQHEMCINKQKEAS